MRWSTVAVLAALALSGCGSSQYSAPDPFAPWGSRRVPPPPTGSLGRPGSASPYYVPPSTTPGFQATPSAAGAFHYPGSVPAGAAQPYSGGSWQSAASKPEVSGVSLAQQSPQLPSAPPHATVPAAMGAVVGTGLASQAQSQPSLSASPVASQLKPMHTNDGMAVAPPGLFSPPQDAIEITQLPPHSAATGVANVAPHGGSGTTAIPGTVAPAGWSTSVTGSAQTAPAATANSANSLAGQTGSYGYQGDYSWLKGKLEYSATSKRWKLRYIARDVSAHRMDDFGGSVVLPDSAQLQGFSPGEFVRVEGQITGRDPAAKDFAPTYHVARIARQTN
jgi:hypothetical protein